MFEHLLHAKPKLDRKKYPLQGSSLAKDQSDVVPEICASCAANFGNVFQAGVNGLLHVLQASKEAAVVVVHTLALQTLQFRPGCTWTGLQERHYCAKQLAGDAGARMAYVQGASWAGPELGTRIFVTHTAYE